MAKVNVQKTVTLSNSEVHDAIFAYLIKEKLAPKTAGTNIVLKLEENELIATIEITE